MKKVFRNSIGVLLASVLLIAFSGEIKAQGAKPHYAINNASADEANKYTELLKDFNLDGYRCYDKRRTIHFLNSNASVDLYSAKELLDTYGKAISPLTIMDNTPKQDIAFLVVSGKIQIVTIQK
ncbi:MAG: hypothetical protein ACJ77K_00015 [Bacteroidia bacterium]